MNLPVRQTDLACWCFSASFGVVLDGFAGSGTSIIAAENLSRGWIGIDINPQFPHWVKTRLESETAFRGQVDVIFWENEKDRERVLFRNPVHFGFRQSAPPKISEVRMVSYFCRPRKIVVGDSKDVCKFLVANECFVDLIYIDPPFLTMRDFEDSKGNFQFTDKWGQAKARAANAREKKKPKNPPPYKPKKEHEKSAAERRAEEKILARTNAPATSQIDFWNE